jgi:tRNA pseudouridine38-40 synthase
VTTETPLRKIRIMVEYDGSRYAGWQRQSNAPTIQGNLEKALAIVLQERVTLTGAGRTDAGVHALGQVAHFTTESGERQRSLYNIIRGANTLLPDDIAITGIEEVDDSFSARRDARLRWYRYLIVNRAGRPAVMRLITWHIPQPLDMARMVQVADMLRGTHDFRGFRSNLCTARRTVLTMEELSVMREDDVVTVDFRCRSYLHNMVRIIVSLMADIARGRLPLEVCHEMLETGIRHPRVATAPPAGLTLMKVYY